MENLRVARLIDAYVLRPKQANLRRIYRTEKASPENTIFERNPSARELTTVNEFLYLVSKLNSWTHIRVKSKGVFCRDGGLVECIAPL
jgi:hypothetical protein